MAIFPVIDDTDFKGADKGLEVPKRRNTFGAFTLRITNLDRADPPAPYTQNGVPRSAAFNRNTLEISAKPEMPKIKVECEALGFSFPKARILWRLQTRYVVGRYKKVSRGNNPHYRSRILSLDDTWTGEASAAHFDLFASDPNVIVDNASDRIAGGHAILTVAAQPEGSNVWLQDYVHLRIIGTNPSETSVRAYVQTALVGRDVNIQLMADAVFAWENAMKQFDPKVRTQERYSGVLFAWPQDPARHPSVAFDYGIGLGQFTHPGDETVGICWDWRDNLDAGLNELLDCLRDTFKATSTYTEWASRAWSMYNTGGIGPTSYAKRLADSDDGRKIAKDKLPNGFSKAAETKHVPGRASARGQLREWPDVKPLPIAPANDIALVSKSIVKRLQKPLADPSVLAWAWPKLEREIASLGSREQGTTFPGISDPKFAEAVQRLDSRSRELATNMAFGKLLDRAVGTRSSASEEYRSLLPVVRNNIDGGIAGWNGLRERIFDKFGAKGQPKLGVQRINAYYGQFVAADFPPSQVNHTPVHPKLKASLDAAVKLLTDRNLTAALVPLDFGGFSIRPNVNTPSELSNHSFGWACDLDPYANPNVKRSELPLAAILALTGLDLYGPISEALRTPRPFDLCEIDVKTFTDASAALVEAFKTMTTLEAAARAAIKRQTKTALQPTVVHEAFGTAPTGAAAVARILSAGGLTAAQAKSVATWIVSCTKVFRAAQAEKQPEITGTLGTVARFGFCGLPPQLVAALIASDGGGLNWLGAARGTKDFMHFDLRSNQQPKLYS